jgi:hypothetical protein
MTPIPDLRTPLYTQADILEMVPGLTSKTLDNWIGRGVIRTDMERPGKRGRLYWTPASVVLLRSLLSLTKVGLPPAAAAAIAQEVEGQIDSFLGRFKLAEGERGVPSFITRFDEIDVLHRAIVEQSEDGTFSFYVLEGGSREYLQRMHAAYAYIVVEIDIVISASLNTIIGHNLEHYAHGFPDRSGGGRRK